MIGAIAGDIVGSPYEFTDDFKRTDFPLWSEHSRFTDDSVLTVATAFSLLTDGDYAENYRIYGRLYPLAGYGGRFADWLQDGDMGPYGSWGNGSAMRVSPIGFALDDENDVLAEAERSAVVTHDHPEGIKGAQATALAVFLARKGTAREDIRRTLSERFGYDLARTPDEIRPGYAFNESCQETVPEALICALDGRDWEQTVRLSVSLGGDADTLACIAGGVAQALQGDLPPEVVAKVRAYLPQPLWEICQEFCEKFDLIC
jgi:ADP-ribosylglycohydrolase